MAARPNFTYYEALVCDHRDVFAQLMGSVAWDERMRSRKTASFGVPYNYSGIDYPPAPFPSQLERLRGRVEAALGWAPNNCLLNLYENGGAKMGMHADMVEQLEPGTGIAIVSLGATRELLFQANGGSETFAYPMYGGSMLVMPLSLQANWRHAVPASDVRLPRISATFRRFLGG